MNMIPTTDNRQLTVRRYPNAADRSYYLNRLADGILCAASGVGLLAALFFLITL